MRNTTKSSRWDVLPAVALGGTWVLGYFLPPNWRLKEIVVVISLGALFWYFVVRPLRKALYVKNVERSLNQVVGIYDSAAFYTSSRSGRFLPPDYLLLEEEHRWQKVKEGLLAGGLGELVAEVESFQILQLPAFTNYLSAADVLALILYFGIGDDLAVVSSSKGLISQKKLTAKNLGDEAISHMDTIMIGQALAAVSTFATSAYNNVAPASVLEDRFRDFVSKASDFPRTKLGAISLRQFKVSWEAD